MARAPIGIQIRRRRLALDLSQAALARAIGISASYLNLIENNKRDVGGNLLRRIGERLQLGLDQLSGDQEQRAIDALEELLHEPVLAGLDMAEIDRRELVARFPEVAAALMRLSRAYADAQAGLEAYENRLTSDPLLSQMLHQVLNRIAGMRSSAEILTTVPDLKENEKRLFAGTINREAEDLSGTIQNLVAYFDQSSQRQRAVSPLRELEDAIIGANSHFPDLENMADELRAEIEQFGAFNELSLAQALEASFNIKCQRWPDDAPMRGLFKFDPAQNILWFRNAATAATRRFQMCRVYAGAARPQMLSDTAHLPGINSPEAHIMAIRSLANYVAGAMVMPYQAFLDDAERYSYDIDLLGHRYTCSFEQVAHRLVTLRRKGAEGVPFGYLRAEPAGRLTKRFPLPGLNFPGSGHGCPLWPLYSQSGLGIVERQISEFTNGNRYLLFAKTVTKRVSAFQERSVSFRIMLACDVLHADRTIYGRGLDLRDPSSVIPVGTTCLLCIRQDCEHRQEAAPVF